MILTLCYVYATAVQWWRLRCLRRKIQDTLGISHSLMVCSTVSSQEVMKQRVLMNLILSKEDRVAFILAYKRTLNLSQWIPLPKKYRYFPICIKQCKPRTNGPPIYIVIQTILEPYIKHEADILEIERFGEVLVWKVDEFFEVILESDIHHLTLLTQRFLGSPIDMNHELQILRIETVDVEGTATSIKYDKKYLKEQLLKYSYDSVSWKRFTSELKSLYEKIWDSTNPRITIENGSPKCVEMFKSSSSKKESSKKAEPKNTLDVSGNDHRSRHKTQSKSDKKVVNKTKSDPATSSKAAGKHNSTNSINHPKVREQEIKIKITPDETVEVKEKARKTDKLEKIEKAEEVKKPSKKETGESSRRKEEAGAVGAQIVEDQKSFAVGKENGEVEEKTGKADRVKKDVQIALPEEPPKATRGEKNQEGTQKTRGELTNTRGSSAEDGKKNVLGDIVDGPKEKKRAVESTFNVAVEEVSKTTLNAEAVSSSTTTSKKDKPNEKSRTEDSAIHKHKKEKPAHHHKSKAGLKDQKQKESSVTSHTSTTSTGKHKSKTPEVEKKTVKKSSKSSEASNKAKPRLTKDKSVGEVEDLPKVSNSVPSIATKPPNVLVYADSVVTKENVKKVLFSILNKERYTVYDLPTSSKHMFWDKSTVLVVVCGSVPENLTSHLIQYLLNGGSLLCLCSDLMYSILHTFTTAEVREHELVRFSYRSWEHVKMMHHIFCYQASPAKKQFSKDYSDHSNQSSSNGSSPIAPRTPSNVELHHNDKDYNIQVQILGTEETWHTPSLLLAKVKGSKGKAVFSQVHLEIDPEEFENDEDKFQSLQSSNEARLEIMKDILSTHLDLVCGETQKDVTYLPGYFLGSYEDKMSMLTGCTSISNNQLECEKINVVFCGSQTDPGVATDQRLPVLIHACPSNFSTCDYFTVLETKQIGRLVVYSDVLTSSHNLLQKELSHGFVVICRQQSRGIGRSNNHWLSPLGSANFSLQMHIPLGSPMGRSLSLIQHLVMTAVVKAIKNLNGCENLELGIKWPNDLYVKSSVKIGGMLVTSSVFATTAIVNIGCGVNLSNANPTVSLNDILREKGIPEISHERYYAIVFNEIENLYSNVQENENGMEFLTNLYYSHWLHTDADVTVDEGSGGEARLAKVLGIDNFGFLKVQFADGSVTSVQPDGNSFDMMRGLISPKVF